jgi:hypothetical protein
VKLLTVCPREMTDGAREDTDGVKLLTDGAREYTDGMKLLTDGAREDTDGMKLLTDGARALSAVFYLDLYDGKGEW